MTVLPFTPRRKRQKGAASGFERLADLRCRKCGLAPVLPGAILALGFNGTPLVWCSPICARHDHIWPWTVATLEEPDHAIPPSQAPDRPAA